MPLYVITGVWMANIQVEAANYEEAINKGEADIHAAEPNFCNWHAHEVKPMAASPRGLKLAGESDTEAIERIVESDPVLVEALSPPGYQKMSEWVSQDA